jgi:hypothetical protein
MAGRGAAATVAAQILDARRQVNAYAARILVTKMILLKGLPIGEKLEISRTVRLKFVISY